MPEDLEPTTANRLVDASQVQSLGRSTSARRLQYWDIGVSESLELGL